MAPSLVRVMSAVFVVAGLSAQQPAVSLPAEHKPDAWVPAVVVFWSGDHDGKDALRDSLTGSGAAVVMLDAVPEAQAFAKRLADLRQRVRVSQGALHALVVNDGKAALAAVLAQRHEFQTITVCGDAADADLSAARRLRARRVTALQTSDPAKLRDHLVALHKQRELAGIAGEVARTLDSFHDAAAVADEDRYFAILPNDSVFLGTDATERWTGQQFRQFAMRYFKRDSAWTYVPFERHVTLAKSGEIAWFDEALDNAGYGECRGSGVLVKRDGRWVLRQYNLTVPIPNDLMSGVAKDIRKFLDGLSGKKR